jgi:hypothetical protein
MFLNRKLSLEGKIYVLQLPEGKILFLKEEVEFRR